MVNYLGFLCPISRSKFLLFTTSDFHSVSKENEKVVEETGKIATQILVIEDTFKSVLSYTCRNNVYIKVCMWQQQGGGARGKESEVEPVQG